MGSVALFSLLIVSALMLAASTARRRPLIAVRADLHRWLSRRAALTGEEVGHLTDRALGAYRAGLTGDEEAPGGREVPPRAIDDDPTS